MDKKYIYKKNNKCSPLKNKNDWRETLSYICIFLKNKKAGQ